MDFRPAKGNGFYGGVMDFKLSSKNVNGADAKDIEIATTEELKNNRNFKLSDYTHVMYVLPKEVKFGKTRG